MTGMATTARRRVQLELDLDELVMRLDTAPAVELDEDPTLDRRQYEHDLEMDRLFG